MAQKRFSMYSGEAFKMMKKILKYNMFEKKDGGFLNRAYFKGKIIRGDQLDF